MTSKYTVRQGDNMQIISQRTLGDSKRWIEIADLNNLIYPFIGSSRSEGVVEFGDEINIPSTEDEDEVSLIEDEEGLLDSDILLDYNKFAISYANDGEFVVTDGDLETVQGVDCLMQDITNRLSTPLGTLPYHPRYGSEIMDMIGNKMDIDWVEKAAVEVSRTLLSDDRIIDVQDVTVSASRGTVTITSTAITRLGVYSLEITEQR